MAGAFYTKDEAYTVGEMQQSCNADPQMPNSVKKKGKMFEQNVISGEMQAYWVTQESLKNICTSSLNYNVPCPYASSQLCLKTGFSVSSQ